MIEKKILFINDYGDTFDAILLYEPNFGVTVVDANDKDVYHLCHRGPDDPKFKTYPGSDVEWEITEEFVLDVLESDDKVWDDSIMTKKCMELMPDDYGFGSAGPGACSFGG